MTSECRMDLMLDTGIRGIDELLKCKWPGARRLQWTDLNARMKAMSAVGTSSSEPSQ